MKRSDLTRVDPDARTKGVKRAILFAGLLGLSACINVQAPEKPIEINLNVNIKQEVVVKLQKDAEDLITSNPELFPK
jgi:YnbE-like lipoprotein